MEFTRAAISQYRRAGCRCFRGPNTAYPARNTSVFMKPRKRSTLVLPAALTKFTRLVGFGGAGRDRTAG